jgi:hypothetical protein
MVDILFVLGVFAIGMLGVYLWHAYQDSLSFQFDVNDGIDPAITEPVRMHELRKDPSRLEALRDRVTLVAFNSEVDTGKHGARAESWLVDSNGATITLETTFEGPDAPELTTARGATIDTSGPIHGAKNQQAVAARNVRIEENARWLADALDVPFED